MIRKVQICIIFLLVAYNLAGQKTIVKGTVTDAETGEPIPFVNIVFRGSTSGTISDFNGVYYLESPYATDSLIASCMGYAPQAVAVKKGMPQIIHFQLYEISLSIDEVVVTPGENPAFQILRNISANKKYNNPERFSSYQYRSYNKLQLDMNNVSKKFEDRWVIKNFDFVFENMDSSEVFGKNYLPILISESVSRFYYQKSPSIEREVIDAFKISGIQNTTISQFSGKMYNKLNIYDNFMTLFEPGFVSPIADFGRAYYKYILEDSAMIDDTWCFKISFKPKRKLERTFYGYFWVADTSFAIKKVQLRVSPDVNINYLNDLIAINEYSRINDSTWFLTYEELLLDFYITDKSTGFFGKKTSVYDNIVLNQPLPDSIVNLHTDTYIDEEKLIKDSSYWSNNRKLELSNEEESIYDMVDSVVQVPTFKRVYKLVDLLFDYYWVTGPVEFGPYYTFYSNNPIEGNRFRFGGRTSIDFSEHIRFGGHVAYGLKDERWKYGALADYMFNKNPRIRLSFAYYHDMRQLGKSQNAFLDDNILTTILRRNPNYKLTMVDQYNLEFEREWFQGFSNTLTLRTQSVFSTEHVPFISHDNRGNEIQNRSITSTEITLSTHFAYREKFLLGKFERSSLGSIYPTLDLDLTYAPKGVFNSDYEYYKINLQISDKVEINPLGYLRYRLIGGKIFGELPYPLLELHEGNETYAYDPYAFNMMNYYEFVSDEYLILWAEHHFQGFFFNRIPLLRWLKLREVVNTKILIGNLSDKNRSVMNFPDGLSPLTKPYIEAGVGIENLFNLIRIDAMWRFSYIDKAYISNYRNENNSNIQIFGLRFVLQLTL